MPTNVKKYDKVLVIVVILRDMSFNFYFSTFRSHDITGALKQAIKLNDNNSILVDLLGVVLEKK